MGQNALGIAGPAAIRRRAGHQHPQCRQSALAFGARASASLLVPFTAFSEYEDASPKGKKRIRWFAPQDRDLWCFAGLWRTWRGDYGSKKEPNAGEHVLFSFLTTEANDLVRPVHAKAMPVILRTPAEREEWLHAPAYEVAAIQARVLATDALVILSDDEAAQFVGGYLK